MEKKTDWSERGKMGPNAFPFWSKQSKRGNLKYWHFASTTCRQCLQLAGRVYLWCTVSTDPRPPTPYMRVNDCSGPFWGKGAFGPLPKYWHFASTTCRQCLQLAGRVHLWCTVSTDPRPPTPYMRVNDCSGPFWGKGAFGPLPKYWHFASTTCRQCLQLAGRVYLWCTLSTDPRPPTPSVRVNDGSGPFWGKGAFGPLPKYWHFASTTCRQCLQLVYSVYMCVCVCIYIYTYIHVYTYICRTTLYDASYCVVLCRTVSYSVVQCIHTYIYIHIYVVRHCTTRRTVSYCVVLCRTVSYCVVLCRTVYTYIHIYTYICRTTLYDASHCVVLCRTVSYCVVLCRTVSYCVVLCRTVSYCVVLCRTVSYCVVLCRTVSYCVVLCRSVSYQRRTTQYDASYSVVQCRTVSYSVVQCRTASYSVVRHCTTRRTVSYKVSGPDASGAYDASYSVVQGVGARRVGDVRRVVQCRTRCRTAPTPYDTVRHSTTQYDTVRHGTTRYDTVRHSTTQYDTVRHSTTRYDTIRHSTTRRTVSYKVSYSTDTVPHSTTQYDTVRHSTTQYDTVRHGTTQYDTVRHSTTQYDTVRHSTTQYDTVRHTQTYTYVDI